MSRRAGIIRCLATRKFLRRNALNERSGRVKFDPATCAIADGTLIAFPSVSRRAKVRRKARRGELAREMFT